MGGKRRKYNNSDSWRMRGSLSCPIVIFVQGTLCVYRVPRTIEEIANCVATQSYTTSEGVPLVSCHRMLEPGSSCHFFLFFVCLAKVIFKSQKQFLILGKLYFWSSSYFFGAFATFWSSCWVLAYGGGSSVRRPLRPQLDLDTNV